MPLFSPKTPLTLSCDHKERFLSDGFVVVRGFIDPGRELALLWEEFSGVLDSIVEELFCRDELRSRHNALPFGSRLIEVCRESQRNFPQNFNIALPKRSAPWVDGKTPIHLSQGVFAMINHSGILDAVEDLIGPEVACHPMSHGRVTVPASALRPGERSTLVTYSPWHRDNGLNPPDQSTIVTVWVPLSHADRVNGCLLVVPGSHRCGALNGGKASRNAEVSDIGVDTPGGVRVEVEPGDIVLIHQDLLHCSLPNRSEDRVRVSLDFRYQPPGEPLGACAHPEALLIVRSRTPSFHPPSFEEWRDRWLALRDSLDRQIGKR